MILHLIDDEKFTDLTITQFEAVKPGANRYIYLIHEDFADFLFVKHTVFVEKIVIDSPLYLELLDSIDEYSALFIHYLFEHKCIFINRIKPQKLPPIVWFFWGQDMQKIFIDKAYLKKTNKIACKLYGTKEFIWPYTNWIRRIYFPLTLKGRTLKKISFCAPVIMEEFYQMKRVLRLKMSRLDFSYGSVEKNYGGMDYEYVKGNNIFVGNSSTLASNHVEVFDILSKIGIGNRQIYVPLSYGNKLYAELIVEKGNSYFGSNFIPMLEFYTPDKYNSIMKTCNVVIMNHLRQQALGNIIAALWSGAKVYMNNKSILYKHFLHKGYIIFDLSDLNFADFDSELGVNDREKNRRLLLLEYGKTAISKKTRALVDLFEK